MSINKLKYIIIIFLPFVLTGCWDSVEINERHVVLEVAIDKNDALKQSSTEAQDKRYEVTYTIPDIAKLSGQDSLSEDVKTAIITKSSTIATSVDEVERKTQNTVTFSHTKALVLGEELLKDKELFKATIDGLIRNMQIGRGTSILAVKGKAGKLTQAKNPQNPIIGLYVMKFFNNSERPTSYAKQQTLGNLIKELQNTGVTTIPVISDQEGTVLIQGAAVIKDYELADWINKEQVRGELFVEGKIKEVPIVVKYKGENLTYNIEEEESKISFNANNGEWCAEIEIKVKGNITEFVSSEQNELFNESSIREIGSLIKAEINKQTQESIVYSKEINVDFLNIGLEMYRKHPKVWESYKNQWLITGYKNIPIKVVTIVTIHNTGMLE